MPIALTRSVSPGIVDCELTHLTREPIDLMRATEQHAAYEKTLWIGENIIYSATYVATRARLEQNGINIQAVETDELKKAEGAVTCCSILIA